jgi:hypothetical protein
VQLKTDGSISEVGCPARYAVQLAMHPR